jgi:hypothetical protein
VQILQSQSHLVHRNNPWRSYVVAPQSYDVLHRQQVLAAGDAPLAYQWWLGSTPVAGATAPILAVAGARRALHQGMYTVQASCRPLRTCM